MKSKIKNKFQAVEFFIVLLLSLYAFILLLFLAWGFWNSLKNGDDFGWYNKNVFFGFPDLSLPAVPGGGLSGKEAFAFGNYKEILFGKSIQFTSLDASYYSWFGEVTDNPDKTFVFGDFIFNSFMYSIVCSFVHAFVAFACAYLCAKYKFRFSEFIYVLMIVIMAIPIVGSSPSMMRVLQNLGIYDTVFSMIVLNFNFTGVYFFVFHAHCSGLSDTYMEAAEIDGASQFGIFLKIIFPLSIKVFFTVFLLQFVQTWNDYQTPSLYYPNHPTLSYAIFRLTRASDGDMNTQNVPSILAGCMVLAIPIFTIFVAFNKLLMGNLTMGGLKE